MNFREDTIVDQIEITSSNVVQVRIANLILKDGVEVSRKFHRYCLLKGNDLSGQPEKVLKICSAVWDDN